MDKNTRDFEDKEGCCSRAGCCCDADTDTETSADTGDDFRFSEYQSLTQLTAIYPPDEALNYLVAGLCSEAGEVAGKWKKCLRGDRTLAEAEELLAAEIGDVLWYCSQLCNELGISMGVLAEENITKLQARAKAGKIQGDGDTR